MDSSLASSTMFWNRLQKMQRHLNIFSEVTLSAHQDQWGKGGMSADLWNPLFRNILEGSRANHTEAQQEDICVGVAKRPQLIKLILLMGWEKGHEREGWMQGT